MRLVPWRIGLETIITEVEKVEIVEVADPGK